MYEKEIYKLLRNEGMTHAGAMGMLGNMAAESSMIPNIAQRGMTNLSDLDYTANFDAFPERFVEDGVGYGLCQWTYKTRKRALSAFAKQWGVSVGAYDMQTVFACAELREDYPELWQFLRETEDIYSATARICREFERPARDNSAARFTMAQELEEKSGLRDFYEKPADGYSTEPSDRNKIIDEIISRLEMLR